MQNELLLTILRMLLAAALGGLIGFEREFHGRPAGLRTHILVSLGAALFTIVSESYTGQGSDPSRIASQIVSGIGFLGAGTIIRQGSIIRGLTTAASLWTTAAIGMAAASSGNNLTYLAIAATIIVFFTLSLISRLENVMVSRQTTRDLIVSLPGGRSGVAVVLEVLSRFGVSVQGIQTDESESGTVVTRLHLRLPSGANIMEIERELVVLSEISSLDWE